MLVPIYVDAKIRKILLPLLSFFTISYPAISLNFLSPVLRHKEDFPKVINFLYLYKYKKNFSLRNRRWEKRWRKNDI